MSLRLESSGPCQKRPWSPRAWRPHLAHLRN
ncbi:hypothetical protein GDO78_004746 [Eleutherodactylus coqui]|uniref:Uncharacterized protein n=1 Tax=Eleutherodactylus coqui TaxID=57060 RepID=A0A8J6ET12_ELECQ|nr:hypothetical protein GDO78_004746 [Eleutherodactylus coqui]